VCHPGGVARKGNPHLERECIMATKKTAARKTASPKAKAETSKLSQMAAVEKVLATTMEPMLCQVRSHAATV